MKYCLLVMKYCLLVMKYCLLVMKYCLLVMKYYTVNKEEDVFFPKMVVCKFWSTVFVYTL